MNDYPQNPGGNAGQPTPAQPPAAPGAPPQTGQPAYPQPRYSYTHAAPPVRMPQPARRPGQPPVYSQPVYQYQQPAAVRPMAVRPAPARLSYKMVRKKSAAPFWLAGLWWVLFALFLTPARPADFVVGAVGCVLIFLVSKLLIRDKLVPQPLTPAELAELEAAERAKAEARRKEQEAAAEAASVIPKEARDYLRQMRQANVAIDNPAVTEKIQKLESRTNQIFQVVSENPEKLPEIRKFMQYYLPTLLKLLRSYDHLEDQGVRGENIQRTMQEIERILDTVVEAFDKQLDNLFEAEAMDISADIQVLQTMLSQEGLVQQDVFKTPDPPGSVPPAT